MAKSNKPKRSPKKPSSKQQRTVQVDFIKGSNFRVVSADGVYGGLTSDGSIHMNFWMQRPPIPQTTIHAVNEDGTIGEEIDKTQRCDIVRDVDVSVVVRIETARAIRDWLDDKIRAHDRAQQQT